MELLDLANGNRTVGAFENAFHKATLGIARPIRELRHTANIYRETGFPASECLAALERLNNNYCLSKAERLLFEHFVRAQYLVTQGFQLLAENKLTGEQWKKLRAIATERASELADNALAVRAKLAR